jgi:hypothetical protein
MRGGDWRIKYTPLRQKYLKNDVFFFSIIKPSFISSISFVFAISALPLV